MSMPAPHYLLYAEASVGQCRTPQWKFVLQSLSGGDRLTAADAESQTHPSRLELLAVVRGLEALDQPSRVTLVTRSRYVRRGLRRELGHWRERRWSWERFGSLVPIRDHDLWQRVDRALHFHQVECCAWHAAPYAVPAAACAGPAFDKGHSTSHTPGPATFWRGQADFDAAPALVLVERSRRPRRGSWLRGLLWLRRRVFPPFSALWRPAFTEAA
jgi:ribonuclease HI